MATSEIALSLEPFFAEEQTDLSQCYGCEEVIYGKMFALKLLTKFPDDKKESIKDSDLRLCESCHGLIDAKA